MTCTTAIVSEIDGDGALVRLVDIGGEIERCLKLEERLSSESSVSSDEGVDWSELSERSTEVDGIASARLARRRV